jgi:hypothetical protein
VRDSEQGPGAQFARVGAADHVGHRRGGHRRILTWLGASPACVTARFDAHYPLAPI